MSAFLQVTAGLLLLLAGAEVLVRAAAAIAARLNIPVIVIGLTVVAFGTSAPELVVSVDAALAGAPGIALGNVIGSNICNILLIAGLAALLRPLSGSGVSLAWDIGPLLAVSLLFAAILVTGLVDRWAGAFLVVLLGLFLFGMTRRGQAEQAEEATELLVSDAVQRLRRQAAPVIVGVATAGLGAVLLGADLLVVGATAMARSAGIAEETIGLTLVAFGTSLPELATTVVAGLRGQSEVAVGNVIGSNIFNILCVIGVTALVTPIPVAPVFVAFDVWVAVGVTAFLFPLVVGPKRIGRVAGSGLVIAYAAYIWICFAGLPA